MAEDAISWPYSQGHDISNDNEENHEETMEQQWALMNAKDRFRASLQAHFITENGKEKCVRCGWVRKRLNPAQKRQHLLHESGEVLSCL